MSPAVLDSSPDLFLALSPLQNQSALDGQADWSPEEEWQRYVQRQTALASMLTGEIDPDQFLDILESHDIDPDQYLEETEETLDYYGF